jgi:AcrR family transcriptional regulator
MGRPLPTSADQTRAALINAALRLFGRDGYDATSTRAIAAAARANIGSITYHFGGKDGLRMAAADHIVETIRSLGAEALGAMDGSLSEGMGPDEARRRLHAAVERMASYVVGRPEAGDIVQFLLRELAVPSPALDRIYRGLFEPMHRRLCRIWSAATGEPTDGEATRLAVFTLIGQVVYFRIGREAVLRRMGWEAIGAAETQRILDVVKRNLDAMLAERRNAG